MTTTPWKPVFLLNITLKDKGMRFKWCSKDHFEKRKLEGWLPVSYKELEIGTSITMRDGESLDTTVQRRNLILCKMSVERAESRRKYFENLTDGHMSAENKKTEGNLVIDGYNSGSYGKIDIQEKVIKEGKDV